MTKKKKILLAVVGTALVAGAISVMYISNQIKKLTNFKISLNRAKIKSFTREKVDIDLFLNFINKSELRITLEGQRYDVFINGVYMTTISNDSVNILEPNDKSILSLNVNFNPSELKQKLPLPLIELITNFRQQKIRVDFTFKVKLGMFTIRVPYSYEGTLKEWATA